MGKKGPTKHMKREMSPKFWPIHRKEAVWAAKPSPGPHRAKVSMPLLVTVRDFLGLAQTAKEAKTVIKQGKVRVDGKTRRDERFSIGLMDVVELPEADQRFRVLPEHGGRFTLHPISKEEAVFKLCRITGKTTVRKGTAQLNLHDGRNVLLEDGGGAYEVNDIVKLNIPEQEITDHIPFKPGVRAIITGGRSQGRFGILIVLGSEPGDKRTATIRTQENEDIRTLASYVFAVGTDTPMISLPGVD
ncbi:MAG: 30S ribosomal protein S4e [Candidatus Bathyarchaeota archaeon]|nr:MAG: 30S ribosomal protein S4e [Candidatus Bathyarchaeota archaeon]